jgi:hypothetical protein
VKSVDLDGGLSAKSVADQAGTPNMEEVGRP